MQMTKKVLSIVLAVMMVVSMMAVMGVTVNAAEVAEGADNANVMYTNTAGTSVKYYDQFPTLSSGSYKVLKSFTQTTRVATGTFGATYEIDLNKQTVTFDVPADSFNFGISHRGGTATIKNGTMNFLDNADDDRAIQVSGGTFNINSNVTINGSGDVSPVVVLKGTLNTAGKLNATDSFAIATHGTGSSNYTINVTGGTVKSTNAAAIYHCQNGTLNISGGTIEGTTGVYAKSGTTNITGGTIKGTGAKVAFAHNGNGSSETGDALVVENCDYPGGHPTVSVTGGTFTSTNAQPVASYAYGNDQTSGDPNVPLESFISGGIFKSTNDTIDSTAFADLCVDSFEPVATTGGVMVEDENEAKIGDVKYATFAEAVAARTGDEVIVPLKKGIPAYAITSQDVVVKVQRVKINGSNVLPTISCGVAGEKALTYTWDSTNDIFTYSVIDAVAKRVSGGNTYYYKDLSSAWNACGNNDTITLLKDTNETWIGKRAYNFNVDLDGHTVTMSSPREYSWLIYGTNTISNGTINFTGANVETGFRLEGGTLTLQDVTVTGVGNISPIFVPKGTVNIDDGTTVTSVDSWAVCTSGNSGNGNYTINVKPGSEITATNAPAIYQANAGTLNISGGEITGTEAVYIKSGTVNITGGTFEATGAASDYEFNGNGTNPTGDAIVVDNCDYPGGAPTVNIDAGTFTSANAKGIASYVGNSVTDLASVNATSNEITIPDTEKWVANAQTGGYDLVKKDLQELAADAFATAKTAGLGFVDSTTLSGIPVPAKASILGVQLRQAPVDGEYDEGNGTNALRFITAVDKEFLQNQDITDYGYLITIGSTTKFQTCKNTTNNTLTSGADDDLEYFTAAIYNIPDGNTTNIKVQFVFKTANDDAAAFATYKNAGDYELNTNYKDVYDHFNP